MCGLANEMCLPPPYIMDATPASTQHMVHFPGHIFSAVLRTIFRRCDNFQNINSPVYTSCSFLSFFSFSSFSVFALFFSSFTVFVSHSDDSFPNRNNWRPDVLNIVKDGNYGAENESGGWNGMVGELVRRVSLSQIHNLIFFFAALQFFFLLCVRSLSLIAMNFCSAN